MGSLLEARLDRKDAVENGCWWRALIDAATIEMADARGVSIADWIADDDAQIRASISKRLQQWPESVWDDPHALGWLHEQYASMARDDSFADHVHREKKHASATVTTQLYTPRWIADALAGEAFSHIDDEAELTVLDPAVGGGQMLLAALDRLADKFPQQPDQWVKPLWGVDLDERAVEVARRTLMLEMARRIKRRRESIETICRRQIQTKDGLDFGDDRSWTVVLTNPPYMGWRSMPEALREILDPRFRPYHADLFAAFIDRCHQLADGAVGILAQQAIWYLRRFEKARRDLVERGHLSMFLHLGSGAFWNLDGEKASVVAFVQTVDDESRPSKKRAPTKVWDLRSHDDPGQMKKAFEQGTDNAASHPTHFDIETTESIPGRPMCHDLRVELRRLFARCTPLQQVADVPSQNKTGRNREYVRRWDEVDPDQLRCVQALGGRGTERGRWVFYSKGGRFAPWWGNWYWVVDWSEQARAFYRTNRTSNLVDRSYWFRQGIVYTDFGGHRFNARWMPPGCVFDMTGPAVFPRSTWWPSLDERQRIGAALAILNSSAARRMLKALNPTLHFQVRDVRALPVPSIDEKTADAIATRVWKMIDELRRWHRTIEGDPLVGIRSGEHEGSESLVSLEKLEGLEAEIDEMVCRSYGVERCPLDDTSVRFHHALSN